MVSPFDVLFLDDDADDEEIKRAYQQRVKETHPDHGGSAEELQLVLRAYRELASGDGSAGRPPETLDQSLVETEVEYLNYEVLADHGWELDDDNLFAKAASAGLDRQDYGHLVATPETSLLEAAEQEGFAWPYACRGGACANCAVAVVDGELTQPANHILPETLVSDGFRLSCCGVPLTGRLQIVYNVKHLPTLEELRLPPYPFEQAQRSG